MSFRALREQTPFLARLILYTVLLSLVAFLSARAQPYQGYVPIWPSGGLGLALLWRHGARYWPAIFVSNTVLSMSVGTTLLIATGVGSLQVLVVMVALHLLKRWKVHWFLPEMRQFVAFVMALVLASSVAIPLYGTRMALVFAYPPARALAFGVDYFLSALFSFLIFTPLILGWSRRSWPTGSKRWTFFVSAALLAVAGVAVLSVDPSLQDRLLFLLVPFVVVCALTAGIGGASAAAAILVMVMIAMTSTIAVPIVDSMLRAFFVSMAAFTGCLLAVVFKERESYAADMEFHARRDALTGLLNRYEFENRVSAALGDTARSHALLYLDLDQFKLINDTCGHLAGDDMLRELARTIERALPSNAILARLGGDEFGCLLPDATLDVAREVARRLHDAIHGFQYSVGTLNFVVGVSIGATILSPADDKGPADVLSRADVACYAAKERGRNRTHVYNPADVSTHGRHAEIQKISQLQSDLTRGAFELHAQRIINLATDADAEDFYEVLLHQTNAGSEEKIETLLGIAQRYGQMAQVDRWVLGQTARFLGNLDGQTMRLSVNVSATSLESDGFREFVLALPELHGFASRQMVLEITEAVAVQNLTGAVETLRRWREHGFGIALDDFGAGVASFGYLSELPVTMVKLDGRFVRDLGVDPAAEVIIESLTRVAGLRGIVCVAEWVENAAIIPWLRRLGVAYAQGFAIHRPAQLYSLADAQSFSRGSGNAA